MPEKLYLSNEHGTLASCTAASVSIPKLVNDQSLQVQSVAELDFGFRNFLFAAANSFSFTGNSIIIKSTSKSLTRHNASNI